MAANDWNTERKHQRKERTAEHKEKGAFQLEALARKRNGITKQGSVKGDESSGGRKRLGTNINRKLRIV